VAFVLSNVAVYASNLGPKTGYYDSCLFLAFVCPSW